jgi:hypothetical protein
MGSQAHIVQKPKSNVTDFVWLCTLFLVQIMYKKILKLNCYLKWNVKIGINFKTGIFMHFRIIQFTFLWVKCAHAAKLFYISSSAKIYICLNIWCLVIPMNCKARTECIRLAHSCFRWNKKSVLKKFCPGSYLNSCASVDISQFR